MKKNKKRKLKNGVVYAIFYLTVIMALVVMSIH